MKIEIEYEENGSTHASCHCYGSLKCGLRSSCNERDRVAFHFGGLSWGHMVYVVLRVMLLYFVKGVVWRSSLEMR
jgi:hypothetical protein